MTSRRNGSPAQPESGSAQSTAVRSVPPSSKGISARRASRRLETTPSNDVPAPKPLRWLQRADMGMMHAQPAKHAQIAALGPWFHNLHLPDGSQTPPTHPFGDFPMFKWRHLAGAVPDDLRGWSVLDIGCN